MRCVVPGIDVGSACIDFTNLWLLYLVSVGTHITLRPHKGPAHGDLLVTNRLCVAGLTMLPVVFIPLVPSDKKITEVVEAVDAYTRCGTSGFLLCCVLRLITPY